MWLENRVFPPGLCNYNRGFIKNFAKFAAPLADRTKKENHFRCTKMNQKSFEQLKNRLCRSPVIQCADLFLSYQLLTYASEADAGAALTRTGEMDSRQVASCFRKLIDAKQGYSKYEKELLAFVYAPRARRTDIPGSVFSILTHDHPLKYLDSQKGLSGQQARLVESMQEPNYSLQSINNRNVVEDALTQQYYGLHLVSTDVTKKTSQW